MDDPTKIYFIRHGQTYFNYLQVMQGWSDTPLTESGHEQAFALGKKISQLGEFSNTIYCSYMNRSIQTCSEINQGLTEVGQKTLTIKPMPELREQFYGSFEGQPKKKIFKLVEDAMDEPEKMTPNDFQDNLASLDKSKLAETSAKFWERFSDGIKEIIISKESHKPILVVTHSAILTALVGTYAPELLDPIQPDNLSITTVEFAKFGFNPRVIEYNRIL